MEDPSFLKDVALWALVICWMVSVVGLYLHQVLKNMNDANVCSAVMLLNVFYCRVRGRKPTIMYEHTTGAVSL